VSSRVVPKKQQTIEEEKPKKTYRQRLDEYFRECEVHGRGVPQSPERLGCPSNHVIAEEAGIPKNAITKLKKHIGEWINKIGLGETGKRAAPPSEEAKKRQVLYEKLMVVYLERLKRRSKSVPEDPTNLGKPDLEKISDESGVPITVLRSESLARDRLLQGIADLRLKVYVDDLAWGVITYGQLFTEGSEIRKAELNGKPWAKEQLYNTRTALRRFFKIMSKSEDDAIGPEFLENFEDEVRKITSEITNVTTRRKFSSEIHRWPEIYRQVLVAKGFPRKFHLALKSASKRAELSIKQVAELADGNASTIVSWVNLERRPSLDCFPFVSRIEKVLQLPPRALTSLITFGRTVRVRREDFPEFVMIDGEQIALHEKPSVLMKLRWLLPVDFPERPEAERKEIVEWLLENLLGPTYPWGYLSRSFTRLPYALKKFPTVLESEFNLLKQFKTVGFIAPGQQRSFAWESEDTVNKRRNDMRLLFGALSQPADAEDPRLQGLGLDPNSFCFAMLAGGQLIHWWVEWKGNRRKDPKDRKAKAKNSLFDAEIVGFVKSLFTPNTGWLRQNPQLTEHLRPIPGFIDGAFIERARNNWAEVCDETYKYLKQLSKNIEASAREIRDPFVPIKAIIDSPNPLGVLRKFAQDILDDMPDIAVAPLQAARTMRNYLLVRILCATALRSRNLRQLTYHENNTGELRREGDKWVIEIHWERFKNKNSSFFGTKKKRYNYRRVLEDVDNIYQWIEEYIQLYRPVILGKSQSDIFFVSGPAYPEFTINRFHVLYRGLTIKYLAENKYTGHGFPGVKPHGPHAVRDIIATYIIRKTGSYELAAYALADTVAIIREHYVDFLPQHKTHLVDKLLVEAWAME
jgi:hypothetical protein